MFYLRLALRLGRSVEELLATVSSKELTLWKAFDRLEPIGDWRHDLGFGVVASTIANANRGRGTEPFAPIAFMPLSEPPKPKSYARKLFETLKSFSSKQKKR